MMIKAGVLAMVKLNLLKAAYKKIAIQEKILCRNFFIFKEKVKIFEQEKKIFRMMGR